MTAPADDPPVPSGPGAGSPLQRLMGLGLALPDEPTGARRLLPPGAGGAAPGPDGGRARDLGDARDDALDPDPDPPRPTKVPGAPLPSRVAARFGVGLAVLVVAGVVLAATGLETVRSSTAGQRVDPTTDPAAPGFEGFVEPSPTTLVVHRDDLGLASVTLLALGAADVGGSVLVLPPRAVAQPTGDPRTLAELIADEGVEALQAAAEGLLGIGVDEVVELDDGSWARLVAPVAPLRLENPDDLPFFPVGTIELGAAQVGAYLRAGDDPLDEEARLVRHQLLWKAWIGAVSASDLDDPVPGERDAGLGRFVRGLAAGPVRAASLPAARVDAGGFVVDPVAAAELVGRLVPFPVGAEPGGRTRVRLLSGTGDPDLALAAAPLVVPAGAQIVLAGNASSPDQAVTEVRYHDAALAPAAERLVGALGTGTAVLDPKPTDTYDVTIVLGDDLAVPGALDPGSTP
jgi:hypothetical protein